MKLIILILVLFIAGCSAGKKQVVEAERVELRADVLIGQTAGAPVVEITFYRYVIGPSNGNLVNVTGKIIVEVENASFNGVALTRETDSSGQPSFKVDASTAKQVNEISASFNGRTYLGAAVLTGKPNALTRVSMHPTS